MTSLTMKRQFKNKTGYSIIEMYQTGTNCVKIKSSLCYPSYNKGQVVKYVQNSFEVTKEEANQYFLRYKRERYEYEIEKA